MKRAVGLLFLMLIFAVAISAQRPAGSGASAPGRSAAPTVGSGQNRIAPPTVNRGTNRAGAQPNTARGDRQVKPPSSKAPRPLSRSGVIIPDHHRCWGHHPCIWFPGRSYSGVWYPGGWFALYPDEWYWFEWYGYSYSIGEFDISGLKFDLDNIPASDRAPVELGIVYVDKAEVGTVKQFTGRFHGALHLQPGTHEVSVQLVDGRELNTTIAVMPGHVTHILLRFTQKSAEPQPAAPHVEHPW